LDGILCLGKHSAGTFWNLPCNKEKGCNRWLTQKNSGGRSNQSDRKVPNALFHPTTLYAISFTPIYYYIYYSSSTGNKLFRNTKDAV
jgi:hypothetical protein